VEHACEHHKTDAKADERSPCERKRDGGIAEQAEVEPGDDAGYRHYL
jgi:hypothetical protein